MTCEKKQVSHQCVEFCFCCFVIKQKWKLYAHVYRYVHTNIKDTNKLLREVGKLSTSDIIQKKFSKIINDFTINLFNISNFKKLSTGILLGKNNKQIS